MSCKIELGLMVAALGCLVGCSSGDIAHSKVEQQEVTITKLDNQLKECQLNRAQSCEYLSQRIDLARLVALKEDFKFVGITLMDEQGQLLFNVNGDLKYPIMSVYKMPIAFAFGVYATEHNISLDDTLHISMQTLLDHKDNYSPLRSTLLAEQESKHNNLQSQQDKGFDISFKLLIEYAVAESDSMASDLLVKTMGGFTKVNEILGTNFKYYELELAHAPQLSYDNYLSTEDAVAILRTFEQSSKLSVAYKDCIFSAMLFAPTGVKRIQAGVKEVVHSQDLQIFDKTGTGVFLDGKRIAVNDMAIIKYQGRTFYLAVFFKDVPDAKDYAGVEQQMQRLVSAIMQGIN